MTDYYSERLSAERLRRCYEIAPPRVKGYLAAEVEFVTRRVRASDAVLELGCGYGRVLKALAAHARTAVGVDTSYASLRLGRETLGITPNVRLAQMNAAALGFADQTFDVVVCIQNGLSAFHVDPRTVIGESIRVARPGGRVLLSSYAERFWPHRLEWFQLQANHGLVGELDPQATGDGVIVCRDGFRARTIGCDEFLALTSDFNVQHRQIEEVDESSLFCEIIV